MSNGNDASLSRPGLRERRLSRVRFDSDETASVPAMTVETPGPLEIYRSGDVDSSAQEYFDAPSTRRESNRPVENVSQGGLGESERGRIAGSGPGSASRGGESLNVPTHFINEDISPRSVEPHPATRAANQSFPSQHASPRQQQMFVAPQQPYAAHVRASPRLPSDPFRVPPSVYASPRHTEHWQSMQDERRHSEPIWELAGLQRNRGIMRQSQQPQQPSQTFSQTSSKLSNYTLPAPAHTKAEVEARMYGQAEFEKSPTTYNPVPEYSAYTVPAGLPAYGDMSPTKSSLKPALKRTETEQEARQTTRDAVGLVHTHTAILKHAGDKSSQPLDKHRGAGVLSNILQLYGTSSAPRRSNSSDSQWAGGDSGAMSRAASEASYIAPARQGLRRFDSSASVATTTFDGELDEKAQHKKDDDCMAPIGTKTRRYSVSAAEGDSTSIRPKPSVKDMMRRRRSFALDEDMLYSDLTGKPRQTNVKSQNQQRRLSITRNVADILQRHNFILKLAKALMTYGAPSHRLESQLAATASVLEVDAQFIHLPAIVIASFGDPDTHTSETHFVKAAGGLDLGKLHKVHNIYREVVHDEVGVQEGSAALSRLLRSDPIYNLWQRMLIAASIAGIICPLGFGGSFVDAWVAAGFGALLAFLQLYVVRKSAHYAPIFEISVATFSSFVARGLSTTDYFCYPALVSSGVVGVLPGYAILCGSLELASRNLIAGSVRMVYAIIYSLFLGFGIIVGSDMWYLFDPRSRLSDAAPAAAQNAMTVDGSFTASNGTSPISWTGTFTFVNQTMSDAVHNNLFKGNVTCPRDPSWEWWRSSVTPYAAIAMVPAFSFLLCVVNLQPIRSRQLPVMIVIACIGYVTNMLANRYIFDHSDIVSFIGAFVVGILGNLYSRLFKGTGFVVMVPGILFMVPSGIAAAGGLAMTASTNDGDSYSNGLVIGFRMVQVAIGITVGLFFSSFIVYSFGRRKQAALFAF